MQFNSFVFIMAFLPLTVLFYFCANKCSKEVGKIVLILSSFIFYAYTNLAISAILAASLAVNYIFLYLIKRTSGNYKVLFVVPTTINICLLLYFKYTNFLITNINLWFSKEIPFKEILLPVGISFFTFQQIAYGVAVFNGSLELKLIDYLAYILYFPKLLMGPLMDPEDFSKQINDESVKKLDLENISNGLKIFSFGLFKKMLLADTFSKAVGWGWENLDTATSIDLILVMLFYTFEIYFDFSGYSDMAVGVSAMLNIKLPINFDSPYKAISIRDFWKRWHISLTSFFTKYIYIPLGGNRKGILFTCLNTMIVFTISGIWHGANWTFILWGILHGCFSLFDRFFDKIEKKLFKPVRWFFTFAVINYLWLLFRAESVTQWIDIIRKMFAVSTSVVSDGLISIFRIKEADFICDILPFVSSLEQKNNMIWLVAFILIALVICVLPENNYRRFKKNSFWEMLFAAVSFAWGIMCLSGESVFVYFGF